MSEKYRFTEQETDRIERAVNLVRRSEYSDRLMSDRDGDGGLGWMDDALCGETDPDMFVFGVGGRNLLPKRVCNVCDVAVECLAYALKHNMQTGMWGGMTSRKIAYLRREYKIEGGGESELGDVIPEETMADALVDDEYPDDELVHPLDARRSVS